MCIIVCKPAGVSLDKELWNNCFDNNDDGAGIMYADDNKIVVDKGHFDFDKLYEAIEKLTEKDIVVHFRAASPGMIINSDNTHPFFWENGKVFSKDGNALRYQWAMCHNGRLRWNHTEKKSDTNCFADQFLDPYTDRDPYFFDAKLGIMMFESFIGDNNKIVVMRHDTEENQTKLYITNESKGHWKHKCWFSNSSYEPKPKASQIDLYPEYAGYYGNAYGKAKTNYNTGYNSYKNDLSWRKKWKEGDAHPPVSPSDIDKFGWFWSYQDHVWCNSSTNTMTKSLTYRERPTYSSPPVVDAFDDETKIPTKSEHVSLEGGVKDAINVDQFEDEGGLIAGHSTINHLEKHEIAILCKKFSSWAKALKLPLGDLRSMNATEKIDGLRELVLENYGNEFPYLETLDIEALDLWILTKIKDSSLKLTIVSEV